MADAQERSGASFTRRKFNLSRTRDVEDMLRFIEETGDSDLELDLGDEGDEEDGAIPEIFETPTRINDDENKEEPSTELFPNTEGPLESHETVELPEEVQSGIPGFTPCRKRKIFWRRGNYLGEESQWVDYPNIPDADILDKTQYDYFRKYIPNELIAQMQEKTAMYAYQNNLPMKIPTLNEIEIFLGLHLYAGSLKYPRLRMYWDNKMGNDIFRKNMTRDRFFQIRNSLHLVDNLSKPADCTDIFWKVRPIFDAIRARCLELPVERDVAVDEQIVPFLGRHIAKQYCPKKPNPWGFKLYMLCGSKSSQLYDFVLYQGTKKIKPQFEIYGAGGAVVMQLAERLTSPGHHIYFDNFFSNHLLFEALKHQQIQAIGTVRVNWFKNPPLLSDREMRKMGRGSKDEVVSTAGVTIVKWFDNKAVHLGSNYMSGGEDGVVERWCRKSKEKINIQCPEIVRLYNAGMGGVDLLDQMLAYYRIFIRSKKWTLRLIFHALDLAVVCAWNEYRRQHEWLGTQSREVLDLLHFRLSIANYLTFVGKPVLSCGKKRGRPSTSSSPIPIPKRRNPIGEKRPSREVQFDQVDHLPCCDEKSNQSRCKNVGCTGKTNFYCKKCNVHLCIKKGQMCFEKYHNKN